MTDSCHTGTQRLDLQFDSMGSVLERSNMAAREQTVTHLPDVEGARIWMTGPDLII
jgi:hypothetical protein